MGKRNPAPRLSDDQLMLDLRVKWCGRCERDLPTWDFAKNKARKDGLQVWCRPCFRSYYAAYSATPEGREKTSQRGKAWYERNRDEVNERRAAWRRANPDKVRARSQAFYAANREAERQRGKARYRADPEAVRQRHRAFYRANRERVLERCRAWKKANPESVRATNRAWVEANREAHNAKGARRRARERAVQMVPFTAEELAQRWAYYGNKCWICGTTATATDHVKPISKGGAHMLCNLRPICKPCNSAKHDKWPFDPESIRVRAA